MSKETFIKPPYSKDSEMLVLGSMLNSSHSLSVAGDLLQDSDFYFSEHQIVFRILQQFLKSSNPCDTHLVCEELERQGKLESVGGTYFIINLSQYAGSSVHIEAYSEIIKDKSILRKIITSCDKVKSDAMNEPKDVITCLDQAQQLFFKIGESKPSCIKSIHDVVVGKYSDSKKSIFQQIQDRQELYKDGGIVVNGIKTGFSELDSMIDGFNKSNLIIVGARPGMGKTALGVNFVQNISYDLNIPVGMFSLEMSAHDIVLRMYSSISEVSAKRIKQQPLINQEMHRLYGAEEVLKTLPVFFDDQQGLKISEIRSRARRMKEMHGIKLLVIDYLQYINPVVKSENRQVDIAECSRGLKNLARELDIPIVCLAQLSRKSEDRDKKKPVLSDLRESGSIEQDADCVILIHRPDYYDPLDKPGQGIMIIAKNRHGETGDIPFLFNKELFKLESYSPLKKTEYSQTKEDELE